jgi:hypothetical protein
MCGQEKSHVERGTGWSHVLVASDLLHLADTTRDRGVPMADRLAEMAAMLRLKCVRCPFCEEDCGGK